MQLQTTNVFLRIANNAIKVEYCSHVFNIAMENARTLCNDSSLLIHQTQRC